MASHFDQKDIEQAMRSAREVRKRCEALLRGARRMVERSGQDNDLRIDLRGKESRRPLRAILRFPPSRQAFRKRDRFR
jgi:hypothetical protein